MTRNRPVWALLLATAAAVLVGCSPGNTNAGGNQALGSAASSATTAPPTTAASTPSPVVTTPPPLILTSPKAAAEHLYDAWRTRNRTAALQGAATGAVDTLFAKTWQANTYFFGGCTTPTAPSECDYNWAQGALAMKISGNATAGFRVDTVSFGSAG